MALWLQSNDWLTKYERLIVFRLIIDLNLLNKNNSPDAGGVN